MSPVLCSQTWDRLFWALRALQLVTLREWRRFCEIYMSKSFHLEADMAEIKSVFEQLRLWLSPGVTSCNEIHLYNRACGLPHPIKNCILDNSTTKQETSRVKHYVWISSMFLSTTEEKYSDRSILMPNSYSTNIIMHLEPDSNASSSKVQ